MKITTKRELILVTFDSLCPGDVFITKANNLRIVGMKMNKIVMGENFIHLSTGYLCSCPLSETVELKQDVELILN